MRQLFYLLPNIFRTNFIHPLLTSPRTYFFEISNFGIRGMNHNIYTALWVETDVHVVSHYGISRQHGHEDHDLKNPACTLLWKTTAQLNQ